MIGSPPSAERVAAADIHLARQRLLPFIKTTMPEFAIYPVNRLIAAELERFEEDVAAHRRPRLIINVPPRLGKSEMVSRKFPPWLLGRHPDWNIFLVSYGADLAEELSDDAKRCVMSEDFMGVFGPGSGVATEIEVDPQKKGVGFWRINNTRGAVRAVGVGGALTGRGAQVGIVDDPTKGRKEADQSGYLDDQWTFYKGTFYSRLEPGAGIIVMACLTGDSLVLMADGRRAPITEVREGDSVRAFDQERGVVSRRVYGMRESGLDEIVEVRTAHGVLRCNRRHPFLTAERYAYVWKPAGELTPGTLLVEAKGIQQTKLGSGYRPRVKLADRQIDNGFMWLLGMLIGDGWVSSSHQGHARSVSVALGVDESVNSRVADEIERWWGRRPHQTGYGYQRLDSAAAARDLERLGWNGAWTAKTKRVPPWIFRARPDFQRSFLRGYVEADGSVSRGTAAYEVISASEHLINDVRLLAMNCGVRATGPYYRTQLIQPPHSPAPVKSEDWRLRLSFQPRRTEGGRVLALGPRHGQEFRLASVTSVRATGTVEPVYDLAVEGENFIADAFVVHNTRWSTEDLPGRLIEEMGTREDVDQWRVISVPMEAEAGFPDPLDRQPGEFLHCRFPPAEIAAIKANLPPREWLAQYQQRPVPAEGAIFHPYETFLFMAPPTTDIGEEFVGPRYAFADTSYARNRQGDYSAMTVWQVEPPGLDKDGVRRPTLGLLDVYRGRYQFPELKALAQNVYDRYGLWGIVIEDYGSGTSLAQEFRRDFGRQVISWRPDRDKVARAHAATDVMATYRIRLPTDGVFPSGLPVRVYLEELANFQGTNDAHDDLVDATTMAMIMIGTRNSAERRKLRSASFEMIG